MTQVFVYLRETEKFSGAQTVLGLYGPAELAAENFPSPLKSIKT